MTDKFGGFLFKGPKLDDLDFPRIGAKIGVGEDIIHAFIDTETAGKSTDSKGRIIILYEPHVAYRNSKGAVRDKLVAAGLAYPKWGQKPYPKDSYVPFLKALAIDETVALLACSWGFPQVLGENYKMAGYDTPQAMVVDFLKDEDKQLEGMVNFIIAAGIDDDLRVIQKKLERGEKILASDCIPVVRVYNGSGYAKNGYHTKFAKNLNKWAAIPDTPYPAKGTTAPPKKVETAVNIYDGKPHEIVGNVQKRLDDLGYFEVGDLDSRYGSRTAGAITSFQNDNGLPLSTTIDDKLLAALMAAGPRPISDKRASTTVADLRKESVPEIQATDQTKTASYVGLGLAGFTGASEMLDAVKGSSEKLRAIWDFLEPMQAFVKDNLWLIMAAGAGFVIWKSGILQKIRVEKHREGSDLSA